MSELSAIKDWILEKLSQKVNPAERTPDYMCVSLGIDKLQWEKIISELARDGLVILTSKGYFDVTMPGVNRLISLRQLSTNTNIHIEGDVIGNAVNIGAGNIDLQNLAGRDIVVEDTPAQIEVTSYAEVTLQDLAEGKLPAKIAIQTARWCVIEQVLPQLVSLMEENGMGYDAKTIQECSLPEQIVSKLPQIIKTAAARIDAVIVYHAKKVDEIAATAQNVSAENSPEKTGLLAFEVAQQTYQYLVSASAAKLDAYQVMFYQAHFYDNLVNKLRQLAQDYF